MHAVTLSGQGGPEVLTWSAVPEPRPGPAEVLLEVAAAGLNRADLLQRMGRYPPPPGAPPYLGLECSGRVSATGPGVSGIDVGEPVCALLAGGGYAERVAVPAGQLLPVPPGVDLTTAAALPEAACTVWSTVFMMADLRAGETLLVHGGTGGIGSLAVQLAVARGATVLATAGGAAKVARCRELGATVAVDYRQQDFVAAARAATDGRGVDVVLDVVGGPYLTPNADVLATAGRLVVIGLQGGSTGELDVGKLLAKRASLLAATLRSRPVAEKARIVAEVRAEVWPLVAAGRVRPVVDRVFDMAEAAAAHRYLERGEHVGKVLLRTG